MELATSCVCVYTAVHTAGFVYVSATWLFSFWLSLNPSSLCFCESITELWLSHLTNRHPYLLFPRVLLGMLCVWLLPSRHNYKVKQKMASLKHCHKGQLTKNVQNLIEWERFMLPFLITLALSFSSCYIHILQARPLSISCNLLWCCLPARCVFITHCFWPVFLNLTPLYFVLPLVCLVQRPLVSDARCLLKLSVVDSWAPLNSFLFSGLIPSLTIPYLTLPMFFEALSSWGAETSCHALLFPKPLIPGGTRGFEWRSQ